MRSSFPLLGFLAILGAWMIRATAFIVSESEQVQVLQFGKPKGAPIKEAGLYFKLPWIQEARYLERRILNWDSVPNEIPTRDKKLITVDTTARWQIDDALKFIQQVGTEREAMSKLGTIIDSETRDTISNYNLVEAVRNSNDIFVRIEERKKELQVTKSETAALDILDEEITGELEKVAVGREELSRQIVRKAKPQLANFGIELIDVQLRRIAYHPSVEEKVYQRMISERKRIAEKIRSVGKGEQAKIKGRTTKDYEQIQSEAYKSVQEILGQAESERAGIYASSYSQDPEFYELYRSLQAYGQSFRDDTKFLLSADSDYLKFLRAIE